MTAPSSQPDARTAREHADVVRAFLEGAGHLPGHEPMAALDALLAEVERLTAERDEWKRGAISWTEIAGGHKAVADDERARAEAAERERDDKTRQISELVRTARSEQVRANAAEALAERLEQERDEARAERSTLYQRGDDFAHDVWKERAVAAEARAQRYREALTHYADEGNDSHDIGCLRHPMHWPDENDGKPGYERIVGGPNAKCTCAYAVARRALACDPLVCRDPDLCWGTGTCPRDPACNE